MIKFTRLISQYGFFLLCCGLLIAIILPAGTASAQSPAETIIPAGDVYGIWTQAGSPYQVEGAIRVPEDSVLTIEPGVTVIFTGNYPMVVEGRLNAVGTSADSIVFTASSSLVGWGGLRCVNAHVLTRIEYCRFELGLAQGSFPDNCGGALYIYGTIQAVNHCTFINNRADYNGGAVYMWGASPEFSYNLFTKNIAQNGQGHAVYMGQYSGLVLNHLTIAGNGSGSGYSLYVATNFNLVMRNSILWDTYRFSFVNGDLDYNDFKGITSTSDSLTAFGDFNFSHDPYFKNLNGGDLRLNLYSPAIDAAAPSSPYAEEPAPNGGRANLGAYGNSSLAGTTVPLLSFVADTVKLQLDPVNFGSQKVNVSGSKTVTLYNVGRDILKIYSANLSSNLFASNYASLVNPDSGFIMIRTDSSLVMTLTFTPNQVQTVNATLAFTDNDDSSDPVVNLTGTGINPYLVLNNTEFVFDRTAVGDTLILPLTISNTGPNVVGDLVIQNTGYTNSFRIVKPDGTTRVTNQAIPADSSITDFVLFYPQDKIEYEDSLLITSNAGNQYIYVSGSGSQPVRHSSPDTLDYGVVSLGQSKTENLKIWNTGDVDLIITDVVLSDEVNFTAQFDTAQSHIAPNDTLTLPVIFHPTVSGPQIDTLQISTNVFSGSTGFVSFYVYLFATGTSQTNWRIGSVSGNWTAGNSPYYIVGDVQVASGQTLTIESGVQVLFEGDFLFTVNGTLRAEGDAPHAIEFNTINSSYHWSGISFQSGSSSSVLRNCDFINASDSLGGAMRISSAAVTLDSCDFFDNSATRGGALAILSYAEPVITNCNFYENTAVYGGAVYADWNTKPHISNCNLHDNSATNTGGSAGDGGGAYFSGSNGELHNCKIWNNTAAKRGGGVFLSSNASTILYENEVYGNSAQMGGGLAVNWYVKAYIHDERIYQNTASISGGGVYLQDGSTPLMLRTLIAENIAPAAQAMHSRASAPLVNYCTMVGTGGTAEGWLLKSDIGDAASISNSILWATTGADSTSGAVYQNSSQMVITYSDVIGDGTYPGLSNRNEDPQFTGTGSILSRYTLAQGSGALHWSEDGGEIGAYGGNAALSWNLTLAMLQNPVQLNSLGFFVTTTVPLLSPPYLYLEQDYPDTVQYSPADSAFMVQISPLIYFLPLEISRLDYPSRATITLVNILDQDSALVTQFNAARLYGTGSTIGLGETVTASARGGDGLDVWCIMEEQYGTAKPAAAELTALGAVYQISATGEFQDGRIEFALTPELLNGRSAQNCAVSVWNGSAWEILPSYLSADGAAVWAPMERGGSYRLVWGAASHAVLLPTTLELGQNYPNPFNPETVIGFALPDAGNVRLEIFDLLGRKVVTLLEGPMNPGAHQVRWDGFNQQGSPVASGIYLYRLQVGAQQIQKKMVLLR
jgi:predicted outer membrane repeat protein